MEIISSEKNDDIKYLRKLYSTRQRKKENKFILEGSRIIKEALNSEVKFNKIFLVPDFDENQLSGNLSSIEKKYVENSLFKEIASTVSPQGIIAVVENPNYSFLKLKNKKSVLVLDRIQDPGNMGTLIRTATAAGIEGIIALKGCVDIYNLKVLKATMGAIFNIPIITRMELDEFLNLHKRSNFNLISTDINGKVLYNNIEYQEPLFLVVGNEADGIRKSILDSSDIITKIPILGKIDSLNAGISGGIIMYEYVNKNALSLEK